MELLSDVKNNMYCKIIWWVKIRRERYVF